MIDNFSLGLTHFLMLYAAWRLIFRPELDREESVEPPASANPGSKRGWGRR